MQKVSCVIPAYNEAMSVEKVIKSCKSCSNIGEIIVVNDASSDNSSKILKKIRGIKKIKNKKNMGKTYSILKGIQNSKNDLILLLDADLINLTSRDISNLVSLVTKNKADIGLSYRPAISLKDPISEIYALLCKIAGVDILTGERIFNRKILNKCEVFKDVPVYGFEVVFNKIIIEKQCKIQIIKWENVYSKNKINKNGVIEGNIKNIKEILEVLSSIGFLSFFRQIIRIKLLIKNNQKQD